MMRVKILRRCVTSKGTFEAGEVIELDNREAINLIVGDQARPVAKQWSYETAVANARD